MIFFIALVQAIRKALKSPSVALVGILLCFMVTTGCSKEAAVPTSAVDAINTLKQDNGPKIVDTWHDNGNPSGVEGTDHGCWGDPTDCYEPIVVSPPVLAINAAFDAISTGNDSVIAGTFGPMLLNSRNTCEGAMSMT